MGAIHQIVPITINLLAKHGAYMVKKEIGIAIEEETVDEIDSYLEYGDSRSAWIRDAIQQKLEKMHEEQEGENLGNRKVEA